MIIVKEILFCPTVKSSPSIVAEIEEMTESRPQEEETSKASYNLIRGDSEEEDTGEVDNTEIAPKFIKESSPCFQLVNSHFFFFC